MQTIPQVFLNFLRGLCCTLTNLPSYDAIRTPTIYLVAIAWIYVTLMMALAEAMNPQGTVLGAIFTFLLYGLFPLAIVLYLLGTPARRAARKKAEQAEWSTAQAKDEN